MRQKFRHEIPLHFQKADSAARVHMRSADHDENGPNFGPQQPLSAPGVAYGRLICQARLGLRRQSQSGLDSEIYPISFGHNDLHCLPALNGATCALGNFPDCLTGRTEEIR